MSQYQEAISRSIFAMKNRYDNLKTIPEELLDIHPKALYKELPQILDDCEAMQRQVLSEILFLAQGSAYTIDHGFGGIADLAQWKARTPISTYKDYRPYIEAHMRSETGQLFFGETALYIATSGSTGTMKYFAESTAGDAAKQLVMAMRGMYMSDLLPVTLDMAAKNLTISNYSSVGTSASGKLIVRASGQTARNMRQKTGTMNILSTTFWEAPGISPQDRDYMIGVYALFSDSLAKVFCNNLAHLGRIFDRIEQQGQQMIGDVRAGHFSINLLPEVQTALADTLPPNNTRATFLEGILARSGRLVLDPETSAAIWPNLVMTGCWLAAGVGRDAKTVLRRLPKKVQCIDLGYGASEGKFNIPTQLNCPSGVVATFACFYEFLPLEGGKALNLWEVMDGCYYELLITTYSGLYRYNLQDIVKIDGFLGTTPNIAFCGKSGEFVWLNRRKCYGFQISDWVCLVEEKMGLCLRLVQAFVHNEKLYYVLEVEEDDFDAREMKEQLDQLTQSYFGWVSGGIYVMDKAYKDRLFAERTRSDRGACGIKLPIILSEAPKANILTIIL